MWSDDDWLKKFSGKTLEENKEEEGSEPPKVETQEVRSKACASPGGAGTFHRGLGFFLIFVEICKYVYKSRKNEKRSLSFVVKVVLSE